jgi:pimeloyl-ACP methyl ester carboxylesterase
MAEDTHPFPAARTVALPNRGPGLVAYLDFGPDDRPVDMVFLHANGFNALTYRHVLAPLARHYRVLAVDQRGHGRTNLETVVEGRRDWLDLQDDLLAFLETLDLNHTILAGHSMGATTCLLAAAYEPIRCRGLILFDPVMPPPRPWTTSPESGLIEATARRRAAFRSRAVALASYRGRGAFRTWPEPMLVDYVEAGFRDLPEGGISLACTPEWEASGYAAQEHDSWEALRRSICPTEIFRAETASTFHLSGSLEGLGDRVAITTVPGTTHFLPMERPDIVQSAVTNSIEASVSTQPRTSVPA